MTVGLTACSSPGETGEDTTTTENSIDNTDSIRDRQMRAQKKILIAEMLKTLKNNRLWNWRYRRHRSKQWWCSRRCSGTQQTMLKESNGRVIKTYTIQLTWGVVTRLQQPLSECYCCVLNLTYTPKDIWFGYKKLLEVIICHKPSLEGSW